MTDIEITKEMLSFISESPSMFHSISAIQKYLDTNGFRFLPEGKPWEVDKGDNCYTIRNHSSIIAFKVGSDLNDYHFQMSAAHSDSPTFKIKAVPELEGPGEYLKLDVEGYGGMISNTWLDKPLSVAGRVLVDPENYLY